MSAEVDQAVAVLERTPEGLAWLRKAIGAAGALGWDECVDHIATTAGYGWQDRFKAANPYKAALAEEEPAPTVTVPGLHQHVLYSVRTWSSAYDSGELREYTTDPAKADVASSELVANNNMHTVMLDIDMPAWLIPSSTQGHSHLYIDRVLPWRAYRRLLKALARAGVIEENYYKASRKRRHTSLRLPGVKKAKKGAVT